MDNRTSTAHSGAEGEDEEDSLPDWTQFAKFAKSLGGKNQDSSTAFIPRRGEKDFEPVLPSSLLNSSYEQDTLSTYQLSLLTASRSALFSALSSGSLYHSSRSHNSFTWRADLSRATNDLGTQTYGVHFLTMGKFNFQDKRIELLPEEALYLAERGAVELWKEDIVDGEVRRVAMSVQQAWTEIIGHDDLTLERFQVYAFLKRLGYVPIRSRTVLNSTSLIPTIPLPPLSLFDSLLATLRKSFRILYIIMIHIPKIHRVLSPCRPRLLKTRILKPNEGRFSDLLSGRSWTSYNQIFMHLGIIPTGHDKPLPRPIIPHTNIPAPIYNKLEPISPNSLPILESFPYQTFFHVYKPITKLKKSAFPEPDFRIVIINAQTTPLATAYEFEAMFNSVPPIKGEDTLLPPAKILRALGSGGPKASLPRPSNSNSPYAPKPTPSMLKSILNLSFLPFMRKSKPKKLPSPYPRLKVGKKSIIVAIIDNGTMSFLKFNQTEFGKLPFNSIPGTFGGSGGGDGLLIGRAN